MDKMMVDGVMVIVCFMAGVLASRFARGRRRIRPSTGMSDKELVRAFGFGRTHPLMFAHRAKIHALRDDAILKLADPRMRGQRADMLRGRVGAMLDLEDDIEAELLNVEDLSKTES